MICTDQQRRRDIENPRSRAVRHDLNGLDFVEVDESQRILTAYFLQRARTFGPRTSGSRADGASATSGSGRSAPAACTDRSSTTTS